MSNEQGETTDSKLRNEPQQKDLLLFIVFKIGMFFISGYAFKMANLIEQLNYMILIIQTYGVNNDLIDYPYLKNLQFQSILSIYNLWSRISKQYNYDLKADEESQTPQQIPLEKSIH